MSDPTRITATIATSEKVVARLGFGVTDGFGERSIQDLSEEIANARLISAAPDLLAALIRVRDEGRDDSPDMWQQVFAAIAKATGRDAEEVQNDYSHRVYADLIPATTGWRERIDRIEAAADDLLGPKGSSTP